MSISIEAAAPTIDLETAAQAEANAAAQQLSTTETAAPAPVQLEAAASSIGELATRPLRTMTVVSGTVYREPKVPGQGQAFANWAMSDLRYDVIDGPTDARGNGVIPDRYKTEYVDLESTILNTWGD